jgi:medium-chain acyl-[acyl-carrier-protein] hydrolase
MPEGVEICPIQLPGRGQRLNEPLITHVDAIVESLVPQFLQCLHRPFALFGHSMGALICFELSRFLRNKYGIEPLQLLVSGWRSPDVADPRKEYDLPHDEFVALLRRLNGTPEEILDNPEALELLLPIVRADFQVCQSYVYHEDRPLSCPIVAFGGLTDPTTPPSAIRPWSNHTTAAFSISMLPGDHFFIDQCRAQLISLVAMNLTKALDSMLQSR